MFDEAGEIVTINDDGPTSFFSILSGVVPDSGEIVLGVTGYDVLDGRVPFVDAHPQNGAYRLVVSEIGGELSADFNNDGVYDCLDLDGLYAAMESDDPAFDLSGDGVVDGEDLDAWRADAGEALGFTEAVMTGDANFDGVINEVDLNAVGVNWLTDGDSWCSGDFNHDGMVDRVDLNEVGVNWDRDITEPVAAATGAAVTVPEPSIPMWLAPLLLMIRRRR